MSTTHVIYHGGFCADGFTAYWVAQEALRALGLEVLGRRVNYGQGTPALPAGQGDDVVMVDFCLESLGAMAALARSCRTLTVLDHHKSQRPILEALQNPLVYPNVTAVCDVERSGAMLAWDHFRAGQPAPLLVRYVQDRDLWRWALPWSREISKVVQSHSQDLEHWRGLARTLEDPREFARLAEQGATVLRYEEQQVERACSSAVPRQFRLSAHETTMVPVVNVTESTLISEVGAALVRGRWPQCPFSATYFDDHIRGQRIWSLRSRGGLPDVSVIAAFHGGGGHAAAAGFQTEIHAIGPGMILP